MVVKRAAVMTTRAGAMRTFGNSPIRHLTGRLVDVTARRPTGRIGRWIYRQPAGHEHSFAQVMEHLGPLNGDRCLEIGCGGGVLLERVLAAGASSAAGLDHSPDMLALSMTRNAEAWLVTGWCSSLATPTPSLGPTSPLTRS